MSVKRFAITLIVSSLLLSCSQKNQLFPSSDQINILSNDTPVVIPKPEVISMISPNQNDRPQDTKISAIVLHHTASAADAKAVGKFFANPESKVSAHYTVDRTGYLVQSVEDNFRAWHAGKSEGENRENKWPPECPSGESTSCGTVRGMVQLHGIATACRVAQTSRIRGWPPRSSWSGNRPSRVNRPSRRVSPNANLVDATA